MKRWLKRVALGVLFSVVLTTIGLTWDWYSTRRSGQNGAVVVQRAVKQIPKEFEDWTKVNSERIADADRNQLLEPSAVSDLELVFKSCRPAIDLLNTLPTIPAGGNRITIVEPYTIDTRFDAVQKMRDAASLLSMHALVAVSKGDTPTAVEDCRLIAHVFRCIGDEPGIIPQLVRMALASVAVNTTERVLGCGEAKIGLAELQDALAEEISVPRYENGLRADRALFYRLLENLDSGALSINALESNGRSNKSEFSIGLVHFRQFIPDQQADFLQFFSDVLAASKRGYADRREACEELERKIRSMTDRRHALLRMLPAIQKVEAADTRIVAQLGCAVAGIACERFRQKTGSWPKSLADIPKGILPEIPTDPFTGKSVLFKRTETGEVVYSVGSDGVDDGGEILDPKMPPGTDVGFRLYDPAHRRLPAKPKPPADGEEPK
jgi:hypothetical protein